ncbi:MAG: J domain-containing protein [Chloroflexi bacterium]|nr:J domain-containing protein [Chloroflexota bacterium]
MPSEPARDPVRSLPRSDVNLTVTTSGNGSTNGNDAHPAEPSRPPTPATNGSTGPTRIRLPEGVPESGLYAVLGVSPTVSDAEIQVAYRRKAARLTQKHARGGRELRQLNAAYEVLGNPTRRAEYDVSLQMATSPVPPRPTSRPQPLDGPPPVLVAPRHRTGRIAPVGNGGLGEVMAVVIVVALAVGAAWFVIPRVPIDLSVLGAVSNVVSLGPSPRRIALDTPIVPTIAPTAISTPRPSTPTPPATSLADHFQGSTVTMSSATPAQNTPVSVNVKLVRDGQPGAGLDVFADIQYRTTKERAPTTGTVKTDASGNATLTFNVGPATPGYAVDVVVYTQVGSDQLSWTTSFTPH